MACGGGGGTPHAQPTRPSARPAAPARTLSQKELEQTVIGAKEIPGWKTGTVAGRGGDGYDIPQPVLDMANLPRIRPAACEPLNRMLSLGSDYQYFALVEQTVNAVSPKGRAGAEMALRSYRVADAPKVIADLRTSLRTCSSFQSLDEGISYTRPQPLADPKLGDEALAYSITQTVAGDDSNSDDSAPITVPFSFVVVRSGATVAAFYTMGQPGAARPRPVPMDVVTAQIDKLS